MYKLLVLEARREEVPRFLRKGREFSPRVIIIVEFDWLKGKHVTPKIYAENKKIVGLENTITYVINIFLLVWERFPLNNT